MGKNDKAWQTPSLWDIGVACVLLTRLPLPHFPERVFERQSGAAWAFPLAGLPVALLAALAGHLALGFELGPGLAAGLVLTVMTVLTGAMHEDGLSDTADGFWGGHDRERRLEIMKDSTTGTYGIVALVMSLGLRWLALAALLPTDGLGPIFAAAALSRAVMPVLMRALPHARPGGLSRHVGVPGWDRAAVAVLLGVGIALAAVGIQGILPMLLAFAGVGGLALLARAKIGGQTGDVLGAAQQVAEMLFLLGLIAEL